jgi:hypothetical protein
MTTRFHMQISTRRAVLGFAAVGIALLALVAHGCTDAGCVRNSECDEGFECQAAVCVLKTDGQGGGGGTSEAGADAGHTGASAGGKVGSTGAGGTSGGRGGSGGTSGGRGGSGSGTGGRG